MLPIPSVIGVVWPAKYIAAFAHVVLAELFGARFRIVMRRAQAGELIEGWERLQDQVLFPAAFRDWIAMVDHLGRNDLTSLQTSFAQRMPHKFLQA
jgi:hypothetical protein